MLTMAAAHNLYLAVTGHDGVAAGEMVSWKTSNPGLADIYALAQENGWL